METVHALDSGKRTHGGGAIHLRRNPWSGLRRLTGPLSLATALGAVLVSPPSVAQAVSRQSDAQARTLRVPIVPLWQVGRDVDAPPAALQSAASVLMDPRTGMLLYEHAGFVRRPPASTTKILTAYLVIRHGHLDDQVTVSRKAASTPGSRMHLTAGERFRVRDLLTGLLMRSGNDAAEALAESVDGNRERFALRMNRAARALGALGSHFENPHGLPDPRHYTTAYDLGRIASAALGLSTFRRLVSTPHATVHDAAGREFDMHNTNRLLGEFAGASGVKTGTTNAAGQCLVASANRAGFSLLSVVLRSSDRWDESASLLRWGYAEFAPVALGPTPGQRAGEVRVREGGRTWVVPVTVERPLKGIVPRRLLTTAHVDVSLDPSARGPVRRNEALGVMSLVVGGRTVTRTTLIPLVPRTHRAGGMPPEGKSDRP